jgi:Na+/H+ antiporter NhaD/arsenite permease-like protein
MGKTGKKLWLIILIKLFIMFAVLRLFFLPDVLEINFSNDKERSEHINRRINKPLNSK